MKMETLKKDNKKQLIMGALVICVITGVITFATTRAKYQLTQSIPLVNGTINYKAYDFKIMAMYQQKEDSDCTEDDCYEEIETMPSASNYKINETKSYCTIDNKNKDTNAKLYTNDNAEHVIENLAKQDKCYLYFDISENVDNPIIPGDDTSSDTTLAKLNLIVNDGTPDFSKIADTNEGIFKAQDDDGTSYYWRGAVTNNYLKFANKWWRIIRINGDGTIRIIYDGTAYHANGTSTSNSIAVTSTAFNSNYDNAIYVGFKYGTTSEGRGLTNKSTILSALETWYTNNLASYASKIDTNAGFCGDRTAYTNANGTAAGAGYGTNVQYFADYVRLITNKAPVLTCGNSADLYTVSGSSKGNKSLEKPIGLINANEVAMAGNVFDTSNNKYYLYNGSAYWTLSPYNINGIGGTFCEPAGSAIFGTITDIYNSLGVRPVINLRADVAITGSGTGDDPFVVVGAE